MGLKKASMQKSAPRHIVAKRDIEKTKRFITLEKIFGCDMQGGEIFMVGFVTRASYQIRDA